MPQEPFSGSGPGGEEPEGPAPLPSAGNGPQANPESASGPPGRGYDGSASDGDWDEAPPEEPVQGLFICLPAEQADLPGFIDGTATHPIAPGPLLAEVVTAVAGGDGTELAKLSEDCLFSVLSAGRRMSSWGTWLELAAMHELALRHPASQDRTSRQKRAAGSSETPAPGIGRAAQGGPPQDRRACPPVPGGLRERRDDRPGTALR
jgi:hypothetical protein